MRVNINNVNDPSTSFYSLKIQNAEGDNHLLPARAFKKLQTNQKQHINEVLINIKKEYIERGDIDNIELEEKLKRASTKNEINIITFFGSKDVELKDLIRNRDTGLLASFESLYNDHLVSIPFSLKFRQEGFESEKINNEIKMYMDDFIGSTAKKENILGYVPAYSWYKNIEDLVKFYVDKIGSTSYGPEKFTYVPLLIDYKSSNVDRFRRSTAILNEMKRKYLKEGTYLLYYAFSVATPRLIRHKNNVVKNTVTFEKTLAKEFLLSFLGFDIIGSAHAKQLYDKQKAVPAEPKKVGEFKDSDFFYYPSKNKEFPLVQKIRNMEMQNNYLSELSNTVSKDGELPRKELRKRKEASEYVKSY